MCASKYSKYLLINLDLFPKQLGVKGVKLLICSVQKHPLYFCRQKSKHPKQKLINKYKRSLWNKMAAIKVMLGSEAINKGYSVTVCVLKQGTQAVCHLLKG